MIFQIQVLLSCAAVAAQWAPLIVNPVPGGAQFDGLGAASLAASNGGATVAAGAPLGPAFGSVVLLDRAGPDGSGAYTWGFAQRVFANDASAGDRFGSALALAPGGAVLLVGSPGAAGPGPAPLPSRGACYVFERFGASWAQQQRLDSGPFVGAAGGAGDEFGRAVALSADGAVAVVGSLNGSSAAGAAFVFERGAGPGLSFTLSQALIPSIDDRAAGDEFGASCLAISANGNVIAVGSRNARFSSNEIAGGAVYIFARPSAGQPWAQQGQRLDSPNVSFLSPIRFGSSVALSNDGNSLLVGAPGSPTYDGAVYVYNRSDATSVFSSSPTAQLSPTPPASIDAAFGASVAVSPDFSLITVGAPNASGLAGEAFVFARGPASSPQWTSVQRLASAAAPGAVQRFGASLSLVVGDVVNTLPSLFVGGAAQGAPPVSGAVQGFAQAALPTASATATSSATSSSSASATATSTAGTVPSTTSTASATSSNSPSNSASPAPPGPSPAGGASAQAPASAYQSSQSEKIGAGICVGIAGLVIVAMAVRFRIRTAANEAQARGVPVAVTNWGVAPSGGVAAPRLSAVGDAYDAAAAVSRLERTRQAAGGAGAGAVAGPPPVLRVGA